MKKHLTLFSLFFVALCINAQVIPNGDFENWTNGNPDSWATYNDLAPLLGIFSAPVTQETPAPSGNSYLKAVSRYSPVSAFNFPGLAILGNLDPFTGAGSMGVPFTQTPTLFSGAYKHEMVASTDSMLIVCQLTKWDAVNNTQITVGTAFVFNFFTSVTNWTNFSTPIIYQTTDTPDSLSVTVVSIGEDGAAVSVDNLGFNTNGIGVNEMQTTENSVTLFPNPAVDQTVLNLVGVQEHLAQGVKIEIIDLTGRVVETHSSVRNQLFQLNTSNLDSGKYLIRISNSKISICKSLIKQ
jgi:hypothetical protein